MKRVLILGGYGGFGARLSQRLAASGWQVIIAGRTLHSAQKLADTLPNATAALADRNGDICTLIQRHNPHLLIDAAGPFQGSGYHVPQACIDSGIAYLDLADARDFVCGIDALDIAAKAAGIPVISGASSVPALSGAVVRHMAQDYDDVRSIEMAISASSKASAGLSVATAILSYVGKSLRLWTGSAWRAFPGWSDLRWRNFDITGKRPLRRLVALADVPDHQLLPDRIAGNPSVIFRAGPEYAFQTFGLWILGWLVRGHIVRSLSALSGMAKRQQKLLAGFGSERSAMAVTLVGSKNGTLQQSQWTLLAENGDGPEIPVMAAQLLAEHYAARSIEAGARDAGLELTIEDFAPLFARLSITTELQKRDWVPLYKRVMGNRFDKLPVPVRTMHSVYGTATAHGIAKVRRGSTVFARLICTVMRFPPSGDHALSVRFAAQNGVERWTRDFGGHRFSSALSTAKGRLVERFGPMRFHFDLPSDERGLTMKIRRWSILRIPFPLWLAPRSDAREWAEGELFHFDVPIDLPLIGRVVHYHGVLHKPSRC